MKTGLTSFSTACLWKNMARKIGADCGAGEENKMAESEVKELEVKEKKRKTKFLTAWDFRNYRKCKKTYWSDLVKADE